MHVNILVLGLRGNIELFSVFFFSFLDVRLSFFSFFFLNLLYYVIL